MKPCERRFAKNWSSPVKSPREALTLEGFRGCACQGSVLLSVTWGLLSIMILTRCLRSLIGVEEIVFGENFDDDSVRVVARPD